MSKEIKEQFLKDVAKHQMTIEIDDGVNRSILLRDPNDSVYWFRIVTWNSGLIITGDMHTFSFRRLHDMFNFFRSENDDLYINLPYWSEKLTSKDASHGNLQFNPATALELIKEHFLLPYFEDRDLSGFKKMREELDSCGLLCKPDDEYDFINNIRQSNLDFSDFGYGYENYTYHYIWCCYAIVWAIKQYDAYKQAEIRS